MRIRGRIILYRYYALLQADYDYLGATTKKGELLSSKALCLNHYVDWHRMRRYCSTFPAEGGNSMGNNSLNFADSVPLASPVMIHTGKYILQLTSLMSNRRQRKISTSAKMKMSDKRGNSTS